MHELRAMSDSCREQHGELLTCNVTAYTLECKAFLLLLLV